MGATLIGISTPKSQAGAVQQANTRAMDLSHAAPITTLVPQHTVPVHTDEELLSANVYPLPKSVTIQVASASGVAAIDTDVFVLNQADLNNITDNGSGAGSITYNYQDGFAGRNLSNILGLARAAVGAVLFGLAIRANTISTGAGDPQALAATNPFVVVYNAFGKGTYLDLNPTDSQTRMDNDDSIMVWSCVSNVPKFAQIGFTSTPDTAYTLTPYFKREAVPAA